MGHAPSFVLGHEGSDLGSEFNDLATEVLDLLGGFAVGAEHSVPVEHEAGRSELVGWSFGLQAPPHRADCLVEERPESSGGFGGSSLLEFTDSRHEGRVVPSGSLHILRRAPNTEASCGIGLAFGKELGHEFEIGIELVWSVGSRVGRQVVCR
jgi:hypothetical protein